MKQGLGGLHATANYSDIIYNVADPLKATGNIIKPALELLRGRANSNRKTSRPSGSDLRGHAYWSVEKIHQLIWWLGKHPPVGTIVVIPTSVKPIQAAPHRYAAPKISDSGQRVRVNPLDVCFNPLDVQYSNSRAPSFSHKTRQVRICLEPSQTINKAMISQWLF